MKPLSITLDEVLAPVRIAAAWDKVRANRGSAGEDHITIADLAENFPRLWPAIELSVRSGTYRAAPLRPARIPKPSGGTRTLAIPSVIDRILQQSFAAALATRWESRFPPCSFAYRPGTGARTAIDAVLGAAARRGGEPLALHLDIRDFFDRIPRTTTAAVLHDTPCDPAATDFALHSLEAPLASVLGPQAREVGIPQGSPLSPVLSNAVLLPFDLAFPDGGGVSLFRYADDMLLLCPDETSARDAFTRAGESLAALGLEVNRDKTRITPLSAAGFLGFGFARAGDRWVRDLPVATRDACYQHLRRMEDSGRPPSELATFLSQWSAYFLPHADDRNRHRPFLDQLARTFGLAAPHQPGPRHVPPTGFSYDGCRSQGASKGFSRSRWAAWHLLHRFRVGLTFRRKGFLPIPSGIRINIAGFQLHFRL